MGGKNDKVSKSDYDSKQRELDSERQKREYEEKMRQQELLMKEKEHQAEIKRMEDERTKNKRRIFKKRYGKLSEYDEKNTRRK